MPAVKSKKKIKPKNLGGRPIIYTKEVIEKFADDFDEWLKVPTNVFFKDFFLMKRIDNDLASQWAQTNERFSGTYRRAKEIQESKLLNGGLLSAYNHNIVKLVLTNKHGWSEKIETKVSGDAANPLQTVFNIVNGKTKDLVSDDIPDRY